MGQLDSGGRIELAPKYQGVVDTKGPSGLLDTGVGSLARPHASVRYCQRPHR
jgi:hypothetical protein